MKTKSLKKQKGFVILFAVIISTIILLIGAGILNLSIKETILSSTSRESTIAFFAADTGVECALYHYQAQRITGQPFHESSGFNCVLSENSGGITVQDIPGAAYESRFQVVLHNNTCADVYVNEQYDDPIDGSQYIVIAARGFNVCDGVNPEFNDPTIVERVIRTRIPAIEGTPGEHYIPA